MPIEYSYTTKIREYDPKIIAVDDCLTRKINHKKLSELRNFYEHIKFISESAFDYIITTKSFEEIIFDDDFEEIIYNCNKIWIEWVEFLIDNLKNDEEPDKFLIPYSSIYIQEFYTYRKYASIYGLQEQFATPSLFYLFDLIFEKTHTELILIEAMPNIEFLKDLIDLYYKVKNRLIILEINEIKPEKIPNSKFYHCYGYSGAWYPTTSSIVNSKDTVRRMRGWIKEILMSEYNNGENCNIGIIKPKRVKIDDLIDKKEFPDVKYLDFGNLRGLNKLEKCNPLFVIGSYNINKKDLLEEYKLWFRSIPGDITTYQDKRYKYNNDKLDNFRSMFEEEEQFHAVFRSRALTYDREVYCFGLIPCEINNLFEVEEIRFGRNNKRYTEEKTIFVLHVINSLGGSIILEKKMREMLAEKFLLKDETARRILKKIVEKNDQLKFIRYSIGRNKPKVIRLIQ